MHLQLMHESLARFSENFASFLYGLNMNAFCVDFPEVSTPTSGEILRVADASGRPQFQIHSAGLESKKSNLVDQQIRIDFTERLMERQRSCKLYARQ